MTFSFITLANLTNYSVFAKPYVFILCCRNIKNLIKAYALSHVKRFCYVGFANYLQ